VWHIAATFVHRLLRNGQKEHHVAICSELKEQTENDPNIISTIITDEDSWVYGYDPETKQQSSQWKTLNSPQPKKARQVWNSVRSTLICFSDTEGIMHKEFAPPGQRVNGNFCCDVLRGLRENIQHKRPVKWCKNFWALHHANTLIHMSFLVRQLLTATKMTVIPNPPCSPDLTPCDFFLFLKMKLKLKGQCLESIEEIQAKSQDVMKKLTQNDFQAVLPIMEILLGSRY
jgi:histone-lysine N-methyltransferase SETMAR